MASPAPLPKQLLEADARLHALYARHAFSTFLNPLNAMAARAQFLADGEPPAFEYAVFDAADDALAELDAIGPGGDHPFAALIDEAVVETRAAVLALRDRTAERFDAWNRQARWYPESDELDDAPVVPAAVPVPTEVSPLETFSADSMRHILRAALASRGWAGWTVTFDPVMSARILVDSPRRLMRLNPRARFRHADARGMVAHEIDVHVRRAWNGAKQPLNLFATGLPRNLATEEGLAVLAEEAVGAAMPQASHSQARMARAVGAARTAGFRRLYEDLRAQTGAAAAWTMAVRLKRGLADPEAPGVYAKDAVYFLGRKRVLRWLAAGGDPTWLYCGKVGIDDPAAQWVADGWLVPPGDVPEWLPALGKGGLAGRSAIV